MLKRNYGLPSSALSALTGIGKQVSSGKITKIEGYSAFAISLTVTSGKTYRLNGTSYTGTGSTQYYPAGAFSFSLPSGTTDVDKCWMFLGNNHSANAVTKLEVYGSQFSSPCSFRINAYNSNIPTTSNASLLCTGDIVFDSINLSEIQLSNVGCTSGNLIFKDCVLTILGNVGLSSNNFSNITFDNSSWSFGTGADLLLASTNLVSFPALTTYVDTFVLDTANIDVNLLNYPGISGFATLSGSDYSLKDFSTHPAITGFALTSTSSTNTNQYFTYTDFPGQLTYLNVSSIKDKLILKTPNYKIFPILSNISLSSFYGLLFGFDGKYFPATTYLYLVNNKIYDSDYSNLPDLLTISVPLVAGKHNFNKSNLFTTVDCSNTFYSYYTPTVSPLAPFRNYYNINYCLTIPEQGDKLFNQIAYARANNHTSTTTVAGAGLQVGTSDSKESMSYLAGVGASVATSTLYKPSLWGYWNEDSIKTDGSGNVVWENSLDNSNNRNWIKSSVNPTITYKPGLNRKYKYIDFSGAGNRYLVNQGLLPINNPTWTLIVIGYLPDDVSTRQLILSTYDVAETGIRAGEFFNKACVHNIYENSTVSGGDGFPDAPTANNRLYNRIPFGFQLTYNNGTFTSKHSFSGRGQSFFSNQTFTGTIGTGTEVRLGGLSSGTYLYQGMLHEIIFYTEVNDIFNSYVVRKVNSLVPLGVSAVEERSYSAAINMSTVASLTNMSGELVASTLVLNPVGSLTTTVSGALRTLTTTNSSPSLTVGGTDSSITISNSGLNSWRNSTLTSSVSFNPLANTLVFVGQTSASYPFRQPLVNNYSSNGFSLEINNGPSTVYGKSLEKSIRVFSFAENSNVDVNIFGQGEILPNKTFVAFFSYEELTDRLRVVVYQDESVKTLYYENVNKLIPGTANLNLLQLSGYANSFVGQFQNFQIFNRYLDKETLWKVLQTNLRTYRSQDPFLTIRSLQEAATKPDGIYTFITSTNTSIEVYIKNGAVLIGRGRNDWNWNNNGVGSPTDVTYCVEDEVKYKAFSPRYLSKANIDAILTSSGLSLNRCNVKLIRSLNVFNTEQQTITWRLRNSKWDWNFWNNLDIDSYSIETPGQSTINGTNGNTGSNYEANDSQRWLTYPLTETNNKVGFAMGYWLSGSSGSTNSWGDESNYNYGYEYQGQSYTTPYTEVYLTPVQTALAPRQLERKFQYLDSFKDCVGLYGLVALSPRFENIPICRLSKESNGDLQEFTAAQLANNEHVTFAAGGNVAIYQLYDQSAATGNGNMLTNPFSSGGPRVVVNGVPVVMNGVPAMTGTTAFATFLQFTTPLKPVSVYFAVSDIYSGDDFPLLGSLTTGPKSSITLKNDSSGSQISLRVGNTVDSGYASIDDNLIAGPSGTLSPSGAANWPTTPSIGSVHYSTTPVSNFDSFGYHESGAGIGNSMLTAKFSMLALFSSDKRNSHVSILDTIRKLVSPLRKAPTLWGWWDETSIETNSNGDFIRWSDKTLNGNYLKTLSGTPIVTSNETKKSVSFNGSSSLDSINNLTSSSLSLYVVAKSTNNSNSTLINTGGTTVTVNTGYGAGNPNFFVNTINNSVTSTTGSVVYYVPGQTFTAGARWSASTSNLEVNQGSTNLTDSDAVTTLSASTFFKVGESFNGVICEVIAFTSSLSSEQHNAVMSYLKGKWSTPTTLPPILNYSSGPSLIAHYDAQGLGAVDSAVTTWKPTIGSSAYDLTGIPSYLPIVKTWRGTKAAYFDLAKGFTGGGLPDNSTIVFVGKLVNPTRSVLVHSINILVEVNRPWQPMLIYRNTTGTGARTDATSDGSFTVGTVPPSDFIIIARWDKFQNRVSYQFLIQGVLISDDNIGTGVFYGNSVSHTWFRSRLDASLGFNGYISEISIFDRPLSDTECESLRGSIIQRLGAF